MGGCGNRVHGLVLHFMKRSNLKADIVMPGQASALQAHYLASLNVMKSYEDPGDGVFRVGCPMGSLL